MSESLEQSALSYISLVERRQNAGPGYEALYKFLNARNENYQRPAKICLVSIKTNTNSERLQSEINFEELNGVPGLSEELISSSVRPRDSCRLFVVENACPRTIALLGGHFDIDPQFFVDHISNIPWYRIVDVRERVTALPSARKLQDFLRLSFIEVRSVSCSKSQRVGGPVALDDNKSFVLPDESGTRVLRTAGTMNPRDKEGRSFPSLIWTRQVIVVWFQKETTPGSGVWTGWCTSLTILSFSNGRNDEK
jgi:hypothetical protein